MSSRWRLAENSQLFEVQFCTHASLVKPSRRRTQECGIRRAVRPLTGTGQAVSALPGKLQDLIESGPMAHLSTINADGSPQVTVMDRAGRR